MLRYLELGLGLLLVRSELRERLLQRAGLRRVVLPLLLQDFSPLLVLPEPEPQRQGQLETHDIKEHYVEFEHEDEAESSCAVAVCFCLD